MKIKHLLAAAWLLAAASLQAAVLSATTAVHLSPDEASAVITYLKAGTTATPTADSLATSPAGWMSIDLPSPYEAYVMGKEIGKSLDVRVGAPLHLLPNPDSGVITTMEAGDKIEITGVRGKWTRLSVSKKLVGFIRVSSLPAIATSPATPAASPSPAPAVASASPAAAPLPQPAQPADLGDNDTSALPRVYEGTFASTRRPFAPRRPFDYQINDAAGVRFAYLDLSKLMLTEAIENYIGRKVGVFGVARKAPGTRDIVIQVDSLQLK